ncbi:MAG: hypothetical protein WBV46_16390 [Terriglobales bacterium]|jgi:hypothetical protein
MPEMKLFGPAPCWMSSFEFIELGGFSRQSIEPSLLISKVLIMLGLADVLCWEQGSFALFGGRFA